jgi:hypothetical protein
MDPPAIDMETKRRPPIEGLFNGRGLAGQLMIEHSERISGGAGRGESPIRPQVEDERAPYGA